MDFTYALNERLFGLRLLDQPNGRILLRFFGQSREHLILLALLPGIGRHAQHGLRVINGIITHDSLLAAQCISGLRPLQLRNCDDITGMRGRKVDLMFALHGKECANTLHIITIHVVV